MKYIPNDFTDEQCKEILISITKNEELPFEVDEKSKVERFCEGGQSIPLNVNDEFVVRFPKENDGNGQITFEEMKRESKICELISKHNFATNVSNVQLVENEEYPFAFHKAVNGKTIESFSRDNNVQYKNLSAEQKDLFAKDLAVFLKEMHSIPLEEARKIPPRNITEKTQTEFKTKKRHLQKYGILLDEYKIEPKIDEVLCHNDLHGRNLAIDETKVNILSGVFDFGMADIGDRSSDFVKLCTIDRNLARKTVDEYNKLSEQKVDMKEVDYKFLSWNAESLEMASKQPKLAANSFEKVTSAYLSNFRKDILAEKFEKNNKSIKTKTIEAGTTQNTETTQSIDEATISFYINKMKNSKHPK